MVNGCNQPLWIILKSLSTSLFILSVSITYVVYTPHMTRWLPLARFHHSHPLRRSNHNPHHQCHHLCPQTPKSNLRWAATTNRRSSGMWFLGMGRRRSFGSRGRKISCSHLLVAPPRLHLRRRTSMTVPKTARGRGTSIVVVVLLQEGVVVEMEEGALQLRAGLMREDGDGFGGGDLGGRRVIEILLWYTYWWCIITLINLHL